MILIMDSLHNALLFICTANSTGYSNHFYLIFCFYFLQLRVPKMSKSFNRRVKKPTKIGQNWEQDHELVG